MYADTDPEGAEFHAALLRRFFAETKRPRLAGAAIRILNWDGPDFLSHVGPGAEPVPSFVGLLADFTTPPKRRPTRSRRAEALVRPPGGSSCGHGTKTPRGVRQAHPIGSRRIPGLRTAAAEEWTLHELGAGRRGVDQD